MAIAYELIGRGPSKALVLHGWFGDEHAFEPLTPSLSTEEFTYCCVAYRGYGASRALKGKHTLDEIAADSLEAVEGLGWDRFSVVGHSMGAKAAQRIILAAPERVRSFAAVTPVPASEVPFDEQGWALFSGAAEDISKRAAIIDYSTGQRVSRTWIDRKARHSMDSADPGAFAAYLIAWAKTDFSREVKGLAVPTLAIVGEHDPHLTLDVIRATYLAWYPNASAEVMRNCGHYPMDETPVDFATKLEAFLRL